MIYEKKGWTYIKTNGKFINIKRKNEIKQMLRPSFLKIAQTDENNIWTLNYIF